MNLTKVLSKMKPVAETPTRKATVIPIGHRVPKHKSLEEAMGDIL